MGPSVSAHAFEDSMFPLTDIAAFTIASTGVASATAASIIALRTQRAAKQNKHKFSAAENQYKEKIDKLKRNVMSGEREVLAREAEAIHLAESRLPAVIHAVLTGAFQEFPTTNLAYAELADTRTSQAYANVLHQVWQLAEWSSNRAEDTARATVKSVTKSLQSLFYEQQAAITGLLDLQHDERTLEKAQKVDHTASQLTRRLQILGTLTGTWPGRGRDAAALLDVVRGAVSRIRDHERVQVPQQSAHYVAERFVEPLVLAVAELLDNAARHSAPSTPVEVSILETHNGISIQIHDAGAGMSPDVRREAALRLSGQRPARLIELGAIPEFGHLGVGVLAGRYGFRASVDEGHSVHGGVRAVIFVPRDLLAPPPPPEEQGAGTPQPSYGQAHQSTQVVTDVSAQQRYEIAPEDGLPTRRKSTSGVTRVRHQAVTPGSDASQSLAAFAQGTDSARALDINEEPTQ
ncbi:ATP-binding protein [Streptomyces sp. NPDC020707]|uniref:ATP-binding protein n=1 Tax=Streptomyces sp. NPDC020707 TaxID=3365084 RepID=UPI00378F1C47